jgi:flavin reductase (DIM6/NTAB) family NADH-FMN oxidoreductase RutF
MVMVAIPRGQAVEPLILDSRSFAINRITADDKLVLSKFTEPVDRAEDQFMAISSACAPSGSPVIDRATSYLDCDVTRHIELEADHRVYVGEVRAAAVLPTFNPARYGLNGGVKTWRADQQTR